MPLVKPLKPDHDTETKALANFLMKLWGFAQIQCLQCNTAQKSGRPLLN